MNFKVVNGDNNRYDQVKKLYETGSTYKEIQEKLDLTIGQVQSSVRLVKKHSQNYCKKKPKNYHFRDKDKRWIIDKMIHKKRFSDYGYCSETNVQKAVELYRSISWDLSKKYKIEDELCGLKWDKGT